MAAEFPNVRLLASRILSPGTLGILALLGIALAAPAAAQYVWKDAEGRRVYSDRPPPPQVPAAQRLRAPDATPVVPSPGPAGAGSAQPGRSGPDARSDIADRELQFRKRRIEQAEAQRQAEAARAQAEQSVAQCSELRKRIATLESGVRMAGVNEAGEREILDDSQRAARATSARETLRKHCEPS